jgi:ABC-type transporter Mla maintaining outer membrane lipid asymmetry permease subunit MlaE
VGPSNTIKKGEKRVDKKGFHNQAHRLVGQEVEVITVNGTFTGTLLSVGSNFIIMRTRIRGRLVRLLIRLALIVALFRLAGITGGSYVSTPIDEQDEDDALSNDPIYDDDDPHDDRRTNRRSERRSNRRTFW